MKGRNTKKGSFKKEENAVSPVIGVILMVAITVILAAVIGAFVFGMGSGVSKTYIVAATANQIDDDITVTYNGGPDADYVINVTVTSAGTNTTATPLTTVGATAKFAGAGNPGKTDHVIVVGYFSDGSQQVVLDTYV